ncbi:MAG: hypothetical protein OHK0024_34440 [Thalassobaculales bacterium]
MSRSDKGLAIIMLWKARFLASRLIGSIIVFGAMSRFGGMGILNHSPGGCASTACAAIASHRAGGGVVVLSTHQPLDLPDQRSLALG